MGRPEKTITTYSTPAGGFGCRLRGARDRAGNPGYRKMAQVCGLSFATLSKAAAGDRMPTWPVTQAFLIALNHLSPGGRPREDLADWYEKWERATERDLEQPGGLRHHTPRHARTEKPVVRPRTAEPLNATTALHFMQQLRILKAWTELSMEQISRRTTQWPHGQRLATSTISDTLRRDALPRWAFVHAFVTACGGRRTDLIAWETAWSSIRIAQLLAAAPSPTAGLRSIKKEMDLATGAAVERVQEAAQHLRLAARIPHQPTDENWLRPAVTSPDDMPSEWVTPSEVPAAWLAAALEPPSNQAAFDGD